MSRGEYPHYSGERSTHYKHGHSKTRLYRIWANMKNRCKNPNGNRAHVYLNRGITVCDAWQNDFQAFYDWAMSNGYQENLTLDRIDNDGNYEPSNCRWATVHEQNVNKASVPEYFYDGIKFHQCDVYELFGVKRTTFQARLRRGLSVAESLGREVSGHRCGKII